MSSLTILCGPPGSGKSTLAKEYESKGFIRISQDDQGKDGHMDLFLQAVKERKDIVIDRMNFSIEQRKKYILEVVHLDYDIEIIVLHQPYQICLDRILKREDHPTIKDEKSARAALQTFFTKYERPYENPRFKLTFVYPEGPKDKVICSDLDGTLCDVLHRRHYVRPPEGQKKNWPAFFRDIPKDPINTWCKDIIDNFAKSGISTVFCSGRGSNEETITREWLTKHGLGHLPLYMRNRHDSRQDSIVKEIIYCFELKTRYDILFVLDDRPSVCRMWRKNGLTVLQCNDEEF